MANRKLTLFLAGLAMAFALTFGALGAHAAEPAPCADIQNDGASYSVCEFDARKARIKLFLRGEGGENLGGFSSLVGHVSHQGETLAFAMNAGMYGEDRAPVGLYIENGQILTGANLRGGAGNFHLKPNGVFWIDGARAGVSETKRFAKSRAHPAFATQSGPMLVIGGRIHPRIHEDGQSEKYRNGVGVAQGHVVRFAISNQPVTFHQFANLFRDRLHCPDALFLDGGSASALYAPSLARHDRFAPTMGPMVGVVEKAK